MNVAVGAGGSPVYQQVCHMHRLGGKGVRRKARRLIIQTRNKEQEAKCLFSHLALLCECVRGADCAVLATEGLGEGGKEEDDQ